MAQTGKQRYTDHTVFLYKITNWDAYQGIEYRTYKVSLAMTEDSRPVYEYNFGTDGARARRMAEKIADDQGASDLVVIEC